MPRSVMRIAPVLRAFCLTLLVLVAGCSSDNDADGNACVSPAPAPPAGVCESIALNDRIPSDVAGDPASVSVADAQTMFDCLSWQTFVALNWPARDDCRGVPNGSADFAKP